MEILCNQVRYDVSVFTHHSQIQIMERVHCLSIRPIYFYRNSMLLNLALFLHDSVFLAQLKAIILSYFYATLVLLFSVQLAYVNVLEYLVASIRAMGLAGSSVNIRDCILVITYYRQQADSNTSVTPRVISIENFGRSSLGACQLFKPLAIAFAQHLAPSSRLKHALQAAGIKCMLHVDRIKNDN